MNGYHIILKQQNSNDAFNYEKFLKYLLHYQKNILVPLKIVIISAFVLIH